MTSTGKTEFMTILRTAEPRYRACKRLRWVSGLNQWSKEQYKSGIAFTFYSRPINNIYDLAELLEKIRFDQRSFIVRGIPTEATKVLIEKNPNAKLRRLKKPHGKVQPTLKEASLSWLMLDIDNFRLPETADIIDDPEGAIDHAIHTLLPAEFHSVRCWWQLSNTAGIDPSILKVHLFFWLAEPKTNAELKEYFSSIPGRIDSSVFNATQPIYVADPVIEGRPDWLPRRTGWRAGLEDSVYLPVNFIRSNATRPIVSRGTHSSSLSGDINSILGTMGDEEGQGGFYIPTRDAAFRYALETPSSQRDDEAFKTIARAAIMAAVNRDPAQHKTEDVDAACSDERLDQLIHSAFEKLGSDAGKWNPENLQFIAPWDSLSLDEARYRLTAEIEGFMQRAIAFQCKVGEFDLGDAPAEMAALAVDVGTGKTRAAVHALRGFIARMRELGLPHRALYFIPTHRLGAEILDSLLSVGVSAATFRGREAVDLENFSKEKEPIKMCLDLAAVNDARLFGLDPERAACGSENSEWRCPYFFDCSYQKQKEGAAKADVVILANEFVFTAIPRFVAKLVGIAIIDESFWQQGIQSRFLKITTFGANLDSFPVLHTEEKDQEIDPISTKNLKEIHLMVSRILAHHKDGYLKKELFLGAGINADTCALAAKYEFARKVHVAMRPGLTQPQRDELKEKAAINSQLRTLADFWSVLGRALSLEAPALCGRLELKTTHSALGTERLLILRLRRDFSSLLKGLPVLVLDATFPEAIVKHFAPNIRLLAEIRVASPFMRVTSIIGGGFGKTEQKALLASDVDASKKRRLARQREFVRGFGFGGPGLLVTYLAAEPGYEGLVGVDVAHFGAIAGRDQWGPQEGQGGITTLFVIGRPMPAPSDVRDLTVALTGKAIEPLSPISVIKVPRVRNGQAHPVTTLGYDCAEAEAVRHGICEAEVVQAIGRARGVSRTANNPVDVFLMANVVIPLTLHRVVRWEDISPRGAEALLLRGILPQSGQDAALLAPDLFPSAEGAEVAGRAIRTALGGVMDSLNMELTNFSFIGPLYKEKVGQFSWRTIAYRRQGPGRKTTRMLVRADLVDGLRDRLSECLGPLSYFEVLSPVSPAAPMEGTAPTDEATLHLAAPPQAQCSTEGPAPLGLQKNIPPPQGISELQVIDQGPSAASGTVFVLGQTPPLPGDQPVTLPPPVAPRPLKLVHRDEVTSARQRLMAASAALEAVRPPHLWGDQFDALRIENWRSRCAAAGAKRQSKVPAWRVEL